MSDTRMDGEAAQMEARLASLHAEYMQLLNDLATLKLNQGHTDAATALFTRLGALKNPGLTISTAAAGASAVAQEASTATASSATPPPNLGAASSSDDKDWELKDWDAIQQPLGTEQGTPQCSTSTSSRQRASEDKASITPPTNGTAAATPPQPTTARRAAIQLYRPPRSSSSTAVQGSHSDSAPPRGPAASEPSRRGASRETASTPPAPRGTPSDRQSDTGEDGDLAPTVWDGGFSHCVEVYSLTTDVRTSHLQELLDDVLQGSRLQPYIRWADDHHAVLVCPDTSTATLLLDCAPAAGFKTRPFSEASQASRQLPVSELLPPKARPKTTATVARKLLSHALGMPGLRDRQGEKVLAAARRERKEQRAAQRDAASSAWGDDDDKGGGGSG